MLVAPTARAQWTRAAGPTRPSFAPELHSNGLIAYTDGHLCTACESVVAESLAARRTAIAAASFHAAPRPGLMPGQRAVSIRRVHAES